MRKAGGSMCVYTHQWYKNQPGSHATCVAQALQAAVLEQPPASAVVCHLIAALHQEWYEDSQRSMNLPSGL